MGGGGVALIVNWIPIDDAPNLPSDHSLLCLTYTLQLTGTRLERWPWCRTSFYLVRKRINNLSYSYNKTTKHDIVGVSFRLSKKKNNNNSINNNKKKVLKNNYLVIN
jgi:hypothetical protein